MKRAKKKKMTRKFSRLFCVYWPFMPALTSLLSMCEHRLYAHILVGRNAPLHQIGVVRCISFDRLVNGDCPWVCLLAEAHIRFELDARFGCENRVDLLRNNIMGFCVFDFIY